MVWSGINPVALQLGPVAIHWYGLMYVAGFFATWYLVRQQLKTAGLWETRVSRDAYEGLFTTLILGVIIGGRIWYTLFYNFDYYSSHPIEVLYVWQGGMSFHGGMVGPIVAGWFYCRKHDLPFLKLFDYFSTVAPLGLMFGRLGNFINGELWGRIVENPADVPWAMVFPHAGPEARHPSQLYEMALEGIALFLLLWFVRKKVWPAGARVAIFFTGYAVARIICENFRQPDAQLGFLFGPVTMGMLQSLPMLLLGIGWLFYIFKWQKKE